MLNEVIRVPFSQELVNKINTFQEDAKNVRYVCNKRPIGCPYFGSKEDSVLSAFKEGLLCECGKYKQEWILEI